MRKNPTFVAILLLFSIFLGGCLDLEESYTINPDGSGKVSFAFVHDPESSFISMGGPELDRDAKIRNALAEVIKNSSGVSAWSDLSFKDLEEGNVLYSGIAYFPSIEKLDLKYSSMSVSGIKLTWREDDVGRVRIEIGEESDEDGEGPDETFSEEQIAKEIRKQEKEFERFWPMMVASLEEFRLIRRFHLSGDVLEASGFTHEGEQWTFELMGEELIELANQTKDDDAFIREAAIESLRSKAAGQSNGGTNLFEDKTAFLRFQKNATPLFDYAAEVEEATEGFSAMMKGIGMERNIPGLLPAAEGDGFSRFELGGLQITKDLELGFHARPFSAEPGLVLSFVGYFDGRILGFTEGLVESGVDNEGQSVLPENEWKRKIHHVRLNEVSDTLIFDVPLELKGNTTSIESVSGYIEYNVASNTELVELGFEEIVEGATGTLEGCVINSVGKNKWGDGYALKIHFPMDRSLVKSVQATDASGMPFEIKQSGSSWSGDHVEISFLSEVPFPEKLSLTLEKYSDVKKLRAPFAYENIAVPSL